MSPVEQSEQEQIDIALRTTFAMQDRIDKIEAGGTERMRVDNDNSNSNTITLNGGLTIASILAIILGLAICIAALIFSVTGFIVNASRIETVERDTKATLDIHKAWIDTYGNQISELRAQEKNHGNDGHHR